jgi:DnaJ homolog subfamily A member 2
MAAFDGSKGPGGMGPEVDMDDILHMFMGGGFPGMGGMGGMPGMGPGGRPRKPKKGPDEIRDYEVSLEEMYKGKTTKFASTKKEICSVCKGTGGKDKAKPHQCGVCGGKGMWNFPT